jgi:hypothetical protein
MLTADIPSVLDYRHASEPRRVSGQVTPGCEWVLTGEGQATLHSARIDRRIVQAGLPRPGWQTDPYRWACTVIAIISGAQSGMEGWERIVWEHPDGRQAKLDVSDFPPMTATADRRATTGKP